MTIISVLCFMLAVAFLLKLADIREKMRSVSARADEVEVMANDCGLHQLELADMLLEDGCIEADVLLELERRCELKDITEEMPSTRRELMIPPAPPKTV